MSVGCIPCIPRDWRFSTGRRVNRKEMKQLWKEAREGEGKEEWSRERHKNYRKFQNTRYQRAVTFKQDGKRVGGTLHHFLIQESTSPNVVSLWLSFPVMFVCLFVFHFIWTGTHFSGAGACIRATCVPIWNLQSHLILPPFNIFLEPWDVKKWEVRGWGEDKGRQCDWGERDG